jgi:hypothetical protein
MLTLWPLSGSQVNSQPAPSGKRQAGVEASIGISGLPGVAFHQLQEKLWCNSAILFASANIRANLPD